MDIDPTTKDARVKAVQVLLYFTLLISENEFICGYCGERAQPHCQNFCSTCAVTWRFCGITYPSPVSMKEQARLIGELLPASLTFIGHIDATGVRESYLPLSF